MLVLRLLGEESPFWMLLQSGLDQGCQQPAKWLQASASSLLPSRCCALQTAQAELRPVGCFSSSGHKIGGGVWQEHTFVLFKQFPLLSTVAPEQPALCPPCLPLQLHPGCPRRRQERTDPGSCWGLRGERC